MSKEETSPEIAALAAKGMRNPGSLTPAEIKRVCASALTQREIEVLEAAEVPEEADAEAPAEPTPE